MEGAPMIRIAAKQLIREDSIEQFQELAKKLADVAVTEEGNCSYALARSIDNPQAFCVFEAWESMEAVQKHMGSELFQSLAPQMGELMESEPTIEMYEEI